MVKAMNCDIAVSEFELQSRYYEWYVVKKAFKEQDKNVNVIP